MPPAPSSTRASGRLVLALMASFVVLLLAPPKAAALLEHPDLGSTGRALAVALGVGAHLPWLGVTALLTLRSDEYARLGLLQAMAIGLGLSVILLALFDHLALAGFIDWGTAPAPWQTAILCWGLGLLAVRIHRGRAA